jgi:hypothetical protein
VEGEQFHEEKHTLLTCAIFVCERLFEQIFKVLNCKDDYFIFLITGIINKKIGRFFCLVYPSAVH